METMNQLARKLALAFFSTSCLTTTALAVDPQVVLLNSIDILAPLQQPKVSVRLAKPYPLPLSGELKLTFVPNADSAADDPSILFSNGTRTASFFIPTRETQATFPNNASSIAYQTGTVAGVVKITATVQTSRGDATPSPVPTLDLPLARSAPVITKLSLTLRPPSGFDLVLVGYSTPRSLTQVSFTFQSNGDTPLQTPAASVNLADTSAAWFQDNGSKRYGSQFRLLVPFTVNGALNSLRATTAILSSSEGHSEPATVEFP